MSLQPVFEESRSFRLPAALDLGRDPGPGRVARGRQIDPPEIVKARPSVRPSLQSRLVCLSPLDWTRFAAALEQAFPEALYSRAPTLAELTAPAPPKLRLEHSLCRPGPDGLAVSGPSQMHFGPETELVLQREMGWHVSSAGLYWPQMSVGRPVAPLPADRHGPERLREAQILIHLAPHHAGHARFARQVWQLLAQFATRQRQLLVRYPEYDTVLPQPVGALSASGLWIGHDALRWARENPERLLAYERAPITTRRPDVLGYGYRPVE